MEQALSNKALEILNTVQGGITAMVKVLQAEFPELVRQLLCIKAVEYQLWIVFLAIGGIMAFILAIVTYKFGKFNCGDDRVVCMWIAIIVGITMCMCTFIPVYSLYKIKVAPKVFLLEYVADLVKPSSSD